MISVSNIVDLIIDKKVKELELLIEEKTILLKTVKEEDKKFLMDFYKKLIKEKFTVNPNARRRYGRFNEEGDIVNLEDIDNEYYLDLEFVFKMMRLNPKGYVDKVELIHDEIDAMRTQITDVQNSKEKLIAQVTLEHLSNIDADFGANIDKLTEKIFNTNNSNKQLN